MNNKNLRQGLSVDDSSNVGFGSGGERLTVQKHSMNAVSERLTKRQDYWGLRSDLGLDVWQAPVHAFESSNKDSSIFFFVLL